MKLTKKEKESLIVLLKANKLWLTDKTEREHVCRIEKSVNECDKCILHPNKHGKGQGCGIAFYKIIKGISKEERNEILLEGLI